MAKYRKTLNEKILLYRIDVYCATMADFWSEKDDPMYFESKQGIYTIAGLMQDFMGENYNNIVKYAIKKLNGYLGENRYYSMEYLTDCIDTSDLWNNLIYRMFYGRDDDCYITNSQGEKEYSQFNPNSDYYYYDGYGNLVSSDYKDYSYFLDDYFIDNLLENRSYLNLDADIEALLDELENAEQGEED